MYMRSPINTTMMITPAAPPPIPCVPSPPKPRRNGQLGEFAAASNGAMEITNDSLTKGSAGAKGSLAGLSPTA